MGYLAVIIITGLLTYMLIVALSNYQEMKEIDRKNCIAINELINELNTSEA